MMIMRSVNNPSTQIEESSSHSSNNKNKHQLYPQYHYLPILALFFTSALSTTFMGLNQKTHKEMEHPIIYALFCLEVAAIYVLYMLISKIAIIAVDCIEHRSGITALSPYERIIEQHIEWGEDDYDEKINEASALVNHNLSNNILISQTSFSNDNDENNDNQSQRQHLDHNNNNNNNPVSILFARGIHREALISSMYLGGSGCFLALPALSFWNISQTCAFLFSLTAIAFFGEHTKLVEFAPNQDKARVLREMKHIRWLLYFALTVFILCIMMKDNKDLLIQLQEDNNMIMMQYSNQNITTSENNKNQIISTQHIYESGSIIMLILAFVSPMLLRLSLPHAVVRSTSLMSPSQVLEAALPVSCLHAILVLGWYGGTIPPIGIDLKTKNLPLFFPMLLICPFCQVIILAFILRGFRQRQTLPTIIILTFTAFIMQQIFGHTHMKAREDWTLFSIGLCVLGISAFLIYTKRQATGEFIKFSSNQNNNSVKSKKKNSSVHHNNNTNITTNNITTNSNKQQEKNDCDYDDTEAQNTTNSNTINLNEINLDDDLDDEELPIENVDDEEKRY